MDATQRPSANHRPDSLAFRLDSGETSVTPHWDGECNHDASDVDRWNDESGATESIDRGDEASRRAAHEKHLEACDDADLRTTRSAYAEHRRRFIAAGGGGPRFDALKLLQAARLQANRFRGVLARIHGEAAPQASEQEIRNSLDGLAVEAEAAQSKGRLRAFSRMLWPFGLPWR